jgi:hypothetical protein
LDGRGSSRFESLCESRQGKSNSVTNCSKFKKVQPTISELVFTDIGLFPADRFGKILLTEARFQAHCPEQLEKDTPIRGFLR